VLRKADFVIIGGGIVGVALARELLQRVKGSRIVILEKERELGLHASGRNSGVLHSGIFYADDSVKAQVCARGAEEMALYCRERKLSCLPIGKLILPTRLGDEARIMELYERGLRHGIKANILEGKQIQEIEPEAAPAPKALHIPGVSIVEPVTILRSLGDEIRKADVEILFSHPFLGVDLEKKEISAGDEKLSYGVALNAGGLHADRIAQAFGIAEEYTILPFKGIYYRVSPARKMQVHGLIYAVPDPRVPFLGIHYLPKENGEVYLGPTVVPALGRENYNGLQKLSIPEALGIGGSLLRLYMANAQGFRVFAHREALRFLRRYFFEAAGKLTPRLQPEDLLATSKVGIRAQLYNRQKNELVMDFLVEKGKDSVHVLNAVSPAFTSAFPFARLVLDKVGIT